MQLLLVDSDGIHREHLGARLRADGFTVACAAGAAEARDLASYSWPHLVVADLAFADGSAAHLARELNHQGELPFIVVSADGDVPTRIRALNEFAEDYIVRPYRYEELCARVRRVLRRTLLAARVGDGRTTLGPDRWVDLARREVHRGDAVARLTPTEARLLELFLLNAGQVLPMNLILQRVWYDAPAEVNTLWEYIRRLRAKLGDDAQCPRYIVSARGVGYQFLRVMGDEQ